MEWRILTGVPIVVQQKLNIWKHDYYIHIHGVTYDNNNQVVIVMTRKRISNDKE